MREPFLLLGAESRVDLNPRVRGSSFTERSPVAGSMSFASTLQLVAESAKVLCRSLQVRHAAKRRLHLLVRRPFRYTLLHSS